MPSIARSYQRGFVSSLRRMKRPQIIGVTVSDTKVDTTIAKTRVSENSRKSRPSIPCMNRSGMKAAIKDTEIDTTVKPIWRAPTSAASSRPIPASMLRWMFSIITIASSTTKPTEMVIAISERLSSVKPASHMAAQVPASDKGTVMPAATVGVARRRNKKTTIITSAMAIIKVRWISLIEARIVRVRSAITSMFTPAGIKRFNCGISAFTRSTVSMTLALACLVTRSSTAGFRLYQPAARLLRTPRSICAICESLTTVPFAAVTTMSR
jgi:hypothetical protein